MAKWVCPSCRKSFDIPAGWDIPKVCGECRQMVNGGPPKPPVPKPQIVEPVGVELEPVSFQSRISPRKLASFIALGLLIPIFAALGAVSYFQNAEFDKAQAESKRLSDLKLKSDQERFQKRLSDIDSGKLPAAPPSADQPITGDLVVIGSDGNATLLVRNWPDHAELSKFLLAKDNFGIKEMLLQSRAFAVDGGTTAKVLQTGFQAFELRIQDGPQVGKSGWLEKQYFKKAK